MKIKPGFKLHNVCGENIIVAEGLENIDFSKIISLNETAAFLWNKAVDKDFTIDSLVESLTQEYDVSEEQARKDIGEITEQWKQEGLIE